MSYNDPCSGCGNSKRDCNCPSDNSYYSSAVGWIERNGNSITFNTKHVKIEPILSGSISKIKVKINNYNLEDLLAQVLDDYSYEKVAEVLSRLDSSFEEKWKAKQNLK